MAAIPKVTETVRDGGLNTSEPASMMPVFMGHAVGGTAAENVLTLVADSGALKDAVGMGPLVLKAANALAKGGGPIGVTRLTASVAAVLGAVVGTFVAVGTASAVTHGGTGPTPTVNAAAATRDLTVVIDITTAGVLGTMAFTVALDGGAAGAIQTSAVAPGNTYTIPGTGVIITFPAGTYDGADTNTFTVTAGGGSLTVSGDPCVDARIRVEILSAGVRGTATFRYSLDGYAADTLSERTYSDTLVTPSGGTYVIPTLGVSLLFAAVDTFNVGDYYTIDVQCKACNASNIATGFTALADDDTAWRFGGFATSAANGDATAHALLGVALSTQLESLAATRAKYRRGIISAGGSTAAEAKAAWAAVSAPRLLVAYGNARIASTVAFPGHGYPTVPAAVSFAARATGSLPSTDLKRVASGALSEIVKNFHDEYKSPSGLDDIRVSTLRTWPNRGKLIYITQGRLKSDPGSDFTVWPRGIVMDIACETSNRELQEVVGAGLRSETVEINGVTYVGVVDSRDAGTIEENVGQQLVNQLLTPVNAEGTAGYVQDIRVKVSRTHNFLATGVVIVDVAVLPFGYVDYVTTRLGFVVSLPEAA